MEIGLFKRSSITNTLKTGKWMSSQIMPNQDNRDRPGGVLAYTSWHMGILHSTRRGFLIQQRTTHGLRHRNSKSQQTQKRRPCDCVCLFLIVLKNGGHETMTDFSRFIGQTGSGKSHVSEMNPYVRSPG